MDGACGRPLPSALLALGSLLPMTCLASCAQHAAGLISMRRWPRRSAASCSVPSEQVPCCADLACASACTWPPRANSIPWHLAVFDEAHKLKVRRVWRVLRNGCSMLWMLWIRMHADGTSFLGRGTSSSWRGGLPGQTPPMSCHEVPGRGCWAPPPAAAAAAGTVSAVPGSQTALATAEPSAQKHAAAAPQDLHLHQLERLSSMPLPCQFQLLSGG